MIYQIQFEETERTFASCPSEIQPKAGNYVVFNLNEGEEIGKVIKLLQSGKTFTRILRLATPEDIESYEKIAKEEQEVFTLCKEKVKEMDIPIKIVATHIRFDKSILRVDFIAEKKLGLRRLTKEITKTYKERIEFRQIGVRTFAKRFTALGVCGRPICCGVFLNEFEPITIDLIKFQNLSCGAAKLTGICGKLMCCLAYEKENYQKVVPPMKSEVEVGGEEVKPQDVPAKE